MNNNIIQTRTLFNLTLAFSLLLLSYSNLSFAEYGSEPIKVHKKYIEPEYITFNIQDPSYFNESIDPTSSNLSISHLDGRYRGTGGLDISFNRHYNIPSAHADNGKANQAKFRMGYGWDLHFGYIKHAFWQRDDAKVEEYLNNIITHRGGGQIASCRFDTQLTGTISAEHRGNTPTLVTSSGNSMPLANSLKSQYSIVTNSGWRGGCGATGFILYSPEGLKYVFDTLKVTSQLDYDSIKLYGFYVSKIEDSNGNWLNIEYVDNDSNNDRGMALVRKVTSNDGRVVNFNYQTANGHTNLSNISYANQIIDYVYNAERNLKEVKYNGVSTWKYEYEPHYDAFPELKTRIYLLNKLTTLSGGDIQYEYFAPLPLYSIGGEIPQFRNFAIRQRITSGTLSPSTRAYGHGGRSQYMKSNYNVFPDILSAKVQESNKCTVYHYYSGSEAYWHQNKIYREQVFDNSCTGDLIRETINTWDKIKISDLGSLFAYRASVYDQTQTLGWLREDDYFKAVLKEQIIIEGGKEYKTQYETYTPFGLPKIKRSYAPDSRYLTYTSSYIDTPYNYKNEPLSELWLSELDDHSRLKKNTYYANYQLKTTQQQQAVYTYDWYSNGDLKKISWNLPLSVGQGNRFVEYEDYYLGQNRKIKLPAHDSTEIIFSTRVLDTIGRVKQITDFNGNKTNYQYDGLGRLKFIDPVNTQWSNTTITYQPLSNGTIKQKVSQGNYRKETTFDGFMNATLVKEWDALKASSTTRYTNSTFNSDNQATFTSLPSNTATSTIGTYWTYGVLKRPIKVTQANGAVVTTDYLSAHQTKYSDAEGNITFTDYLSYGTPQMRKATFISSPENVKTEIQYNKFGNVLSISQGGITENRVYDTHQNLCKTVRPDTGNTAFGHNLLGEKTWHASGSSVSSSTLNCDNVVSPEHKVSYIYGNTGLVKSITFGDNSPDQIYDYDANDNLKTLTAGTVTRSYNYNSANLIKDETVSLPSKTLAVKYQYSSLGHVSSLTYPDGDIVNFSPNGLGQPTQALRTFRRNAGGEYTYVSGATYYPSGSIDTFTYGNGLTHKTTLNNYSVPVSIKDLNSSFTAFNYNYSYDNNLNVKSIIDGVNDAYSLTNLTYDGLDRLTATTGKTGIGSSTIKYDVLGNITQYSSKNRELDYHYNSKNLLTSVSILGNSPSDTPLPYKDFEYDDRGNVSDNGLMAFTYNRANQMVSAGGGKTFLYDGHNRRVKKTTNDETSYSLYSQSGTLLYRETDGKEINYIYLGSRLVAKDGVISENAGSQHFRPFGSSIEGEINDAGYAGHKFDTDLGLSYMQARYYDPVIGRFYSNDPVGFRDVHSFNRYAYANSNPYKYTDPDGRESMFAFHADLDVKALGSGNITRGEFAARSNARSKAAVIPLVAAVVVATRGAAALPIIQKVKSEVKQEVVAQVLSAAIEIAANQVGVEGTNPSQNDGKLNGNPKRTENSSESISPEKSAKKDSKKEMRSKPQPPPKPRIKFKRR